MGIWYRFYIDSIEIDLQWSFEIKNRDSHPVKNNSVINLHYLEGKKPPPFSKGTPPIVIFVPSNIMSFFR